MNHQIAPDNLRNILTKLKTSNKGRKEEPFTTCRDLADQVLALMAQEDARAKGILVNIEKIYTTTTSGVIRIAIENCFIYRLSIQLATCGAYSRLLAQLPKTLSELLRRQILATGP